MEGNFAKKKYYNYHKHDHKSNPVTLDVVSKLEDYCKRAIELGHDAIFTTNHGIQGDIFEATTLAHQYNLKLIVGAEGYYVPDRKEKDKSNRHIILIALNHEGIRELNYIISESFTTGFYYKPRIDDELLFSLTPENFIITTACIAGLWNDEDLIKRLKEHFKGNFYLEVQNHNEEAQKNANRKIIELSKKYNIKLIHANDSHYIYPEEKKEWDKITINDKEYELLPANRDLFLRAKGIIYEEESNFVLDYPDYDTIVERYKKQGVLNDNQIKEALDSTLIFENIDCSDFINDEIKLPNISKNPNQELKDIINKAWEKDRERIDRSEWARYIEAIRYEIDIIEKTNMADYFLIDYNIVKIAKEKYDGVLTNTGRGSAPSFYITKLLDLTNIDRLASPITLFPTRFMSVERILGARSMPDIDLNTADAEPFIKASKDLLGENNCAWMVSWKPLQESSGFRLYCKAIGMDINEYNDVAKDLDKYKDDIEWGKVIEASKPFIGVIEGVSESPCSMCLYDKDIRREIGMIRTPNGKICCLLDGYNCDKYKYLKNDYLTVMVWAIIRDTCKMANIKIPSISELDNLLDDKTFDIYKKGLTCSINQADSNYATGLVTRYKPKSLSEMSAFVAIIRPGCASLLDDFIERKEYTTGVPALDNILEDSGHRLIYQESIMKYLIWLGIPETGSYDIIKKIAKKKFKEPELKELKEKLIQGWIKQVGQEDGFEETWHVVEDAAKYSFNCIAGDTKIQRLGQKKSCFNPTIEEMYLIKNDKNYAIETGHKDLHMKYKKHGYGNAYSMFEDNRIHKNKIVDIYYTGIQKIYRVKTKNGSYVDCTMNHKFPTPMGDKKLQDLTIGSELYIKGVYEKHPDNYRLTKVDKIESITYLREDKVYDIEMQNPAHNFISESGLVVSNCSHSLSYAYDSLYGAYLKSHYPLEYYSVALNYYNGDEERTKKLISELPYFNISLKKPTFRYSKSTYFMDKETNTIYKGTSAIKFLNASASDYLYSLRDNKYNDFVDLLIQITNDKDDEGRAYINSRQLEILIKLQFFEEFGHNGKLLDVYKAFTSLYGRKVIQKDKIYELPVSLDVVAKNALTETDKQYRDVNIEKILHEYEKSVPNNNLKVSEQIKFEIEILGYINTTYPETERSICLVKDIDTKFTPKATIYCLKNGKEIECKINKKIFKAKPFKKNSLIKANEFEKKPKWVKVEEGFEKSTTETEWHLVNYQIMNEEELC